MQLGIFGSGAAAPNSTAARDFADFIENDIEAEALGFHSVPMEEAAARLDEALDVIIKGSVTATSAASR
jgi:hypothetical protein